MNSGNYTVHVSLAGCSFSGPGQQPARNVHLSASVSGVDFGPGSGTSCEGTPAKSGATSGEQQLVG